MVELRTRDEATSWARGQSTSRSYDWTAMCLKFTRMCFNVSSLYPSAETAWYKTKKRHTSWPPPKGAPVWWTNGRYGHVVISDGDGYCWSNDFARRGHIDRVSIAAITRGWGHTYRGWTEDINGVTVYFGDVSLPEIDASYIARATRGRLSAPMGKYLKRKVAKEVGRGRMNLMSNRLGRSFRRRYKLVQEKYLKANGMKVTAELADGIPGVVSLTWLGKRHGFKVKP